MKIGCFALVEPFATMERQFQEIHGMGIHYADITDNHDGGSLGVEFGFTGSISLDTHPAQIRRMVRRNGITLTSFCAHANLLDPTAPDRYGTAQIIKAIRLAHHLGIKHVITTEGDPKTEFGRGLTPEQRIFAIREKLYEPVLWAKELGVELLLETHGVVTDSVEAMGELLDQLGYPDTVGVCLDTGNCWLGGTEPLDFIRAFGKRIRHVHWKDVPAAWAEKRGQEHGCGMSVVALGDGVVGIAGIVKALKEAGFDGATTLEVAGTANVIASAERLRQWIAG